MNIQTFTLGALQVNSYLAWCPNSMKGVLIDPGEEPHEILEFIENREICLEYIILTHAHYDHVQGVSEIQSRWKVPILAHPMAQSFLNILPEQTALFNHEWIGPIPRVDRVLKEEEIVEFGSASLKVIYTPGHSECGITLLGDREAFVGDLIFYNSVGRTDFYGGSPEALLNSINNKIFLLDPSIILYSGHGPVTSVEREKLQNPFV